jgi:hypothetical protein
MTDAERQARYRAARATDAPMIRMRRPADHRSRARRWHDAVGDLSALQTQYAEWLEALPPNLQDSALADARSVISTAANSRKSTRHAGSAATDDRPPRRPDRLKPQRRGVKYG